MLITQLLKRMQMIWVSLGALKFALSLNGRVLWSLCTCILHGIQVQAFKPSSGQDLALAVICFFVHGQVINNGHLRN